mmetsp:Transcript_4723/g.5251  ORF Transcript_4723/g.5251 Transcript_4723/m.5251 type:complete len:128 (+) Transcript_4723:135-518(+)
MCSPNIHSWLTTNEGRMHIKWYYLDSYQNFHTNDVLAVAVANATEVVMAAVTATSFLVMVDRSKTRGRFYSQEKAIHSLASAKGRLSCDDYYCAGDYHGCRFDCLYYCLSSVSAYASQQRRRCCPSI